jgi:hypothetical protein
MSSEGSSATGGGVGFCGLLTIVFIVLKLCGVIPWKWLWVLSPLWIGWGLILALVILVLVIGAISESRRY